ncbi:MAG: hypothetical protein KF752_02975 [Pirellulaceae bacterium]|nr:hypothetical protein [Pirellulaceae bacterium]
MIQFGSRILPVLVAPLLVVLTAGAGGRVQTQVHRVDLVEWNHCYDDLGRHCYDQIVFYEWSPDYRRYHVVAWCLVDNNLSRLPSLDRAKNQYVVRWHDRDTGRSREIWSPLYRETWSNSDPERANKKLMDEKYRVSLLRQPARDQWR